MRTTTIAVLLLVLAPPLLAGPAEAEEAALAERVTTLLQSEAPVDRAWGAYLAGKHGVRSAVPLLLARLREDGGVTGLDGYEGQALRQAIVDALIRLGGRPDLETCEPLVRKDPRFAMVLLSGYGPEAEPLLRPLLEVREGISRTTWKAVRMLLAEWRSPHLAAVLLTGLEQKAQVTVLNSNSLIGIGGGSSDRARHHRELLIKMPPGWPPAVRYMLTDIAAPGVTLLAPGTHPVYYRRAEVVRGSDNGVAGVEDSISPPEFRILCLAHLMRWEPGFVGFRHASENMVWYENDEQYLEEAQGWLDRIREKHANLVTQLVSNKLLTEEEAGQVRLDLEISVLDHRPAGERTELPDLK